MRGFAPVERLNQRLNDAHRSVIGSGIAPRFEIVGFRHMPLAKLGSLVAMRAEKHFQVDSIRFQRRSEFEIGGRVVGWVPSENQQDLNFAGAHVFDERMQRLVAVDWVGVDRFGVDDRLADVAQRLVDGVCKGMDDGRLMIAGDHHAGTSMRLQVFRQSGDKLRLLTTYAASGIYADSATQRASKGLNIPRPPRHSAARLDRKSVM